MVKHRKPLAATYRGLLILGLSGGVAIALLSIAMFSFPDTGEPIYRGLMRWLTRAGAVKLDRDDYYFTAAMVGVLSPFWVLLFVWAMLRKPAEDRHIDAQLRARLPRQGRERRIDLDQSDMDR